MHTLSRLVSILLPPKKKRFTMFHHLYYSPSTLNDNGQRTIASTMQPSQQAHAFGKAVILPRKHLKRVLVAARPRVGTPPNAALTQTYRRSENPAKDHEVHQAA